MDDCLACALTAGRLPLPGGAIHGTGLWCVEHCVGPLGLGTLIVKPQRHVTAVAALTDAEAAELGPLLRRAAAVASRLTDEPPEQVYTCLWSHAGGTPGHIHYVVQPVTRTTMDAHGAFGPQLQVAMLAAGAGPDADAIGPVAARARALFAEQP